LDLEDQKTSFKGCSVNGVALVGRGVPNENGPLLSERATLDLQ
jgi:hypothetical protein